MLNNPHHSSITFYTTNNLKTSFDELVKFKRMSRTSVINTLMENFVRTEIKLMKEDNNMVSFIKDMKVRSHKNNPPQFKKVDEQTYVETYDPPVPPTVNEPEYSKDDWNDPSGLGRLWSLK